MKSTRYSESMKKRIIAERKEQQHFLSLLVFLSAMALMVIFPAGEVRADEPVLVKDIWVGDSNSNSSPYDLTDVNGTLYFAADGGLGDVELWKSDGTAAGTMRVKDIYQGPQGSSLSRLTNVNGTLYFRADNGTDGIELWQSDGKATGTQMVADINTLLGGSSSPSYLTNVNGTLYFTANDGNGTEVWKIDAAGNTVMFDLNNGPGGSSIDNLVNVNGTLYFAAAVSGSWELWQSDGSETGTVVVSGVSTDANYLTNVNGTLYFTANDGNGTELWKIDGSTTALVANINDAPGGSSNPSNLTNVNGTLYFRANNGTDGVELWQSDGTATGTQMVADINTSLGGSSNPSYLTNVNGTLYFAANDGNGIELWKIDAAGNTMMFDLSSVPGGSYPWRLTNVNGTLYFNADDGTNGAQLWQSDGTTAGTTIVKDINTVTGANDPSELTNVNGALYFNASDATNGYELWKVAYAPTVSTIPDQSNYSKTIVLSFTVSDVETGSDELVLTTESSNQMILPNANITLGGSGENRTITLSPAADLDGTTLVTITVSDGVYATTMSFNATWRVPITVSPTEPFDPLANADSISAAVAGASEGDFILLQDGIYRGTGNKKINLIGVNVIIISENGPENTTIDLEYDGRAFDFFPGNNSTLDGLTIMNGAAPGNSGGGALYINGASPHIVNSRFIRNNAHIGGAIYISGDSSPVINNCAFISNDATHGGAITFQSYSVLSNTEIRESTFTKNNSLFDGGAILLLDQAESGGLILADSTFKENASNGRGGAVYLASTTNNKRIINTIFLNNHSEKGGAIGSQGLMIVNSNLYGNTASLEGGGSYFFGLNTVENSLLWGNTSVRGGQIHNEGVLSIGYSNLEGNLVAITNGSGSVDLVDLDGNINRDPLFALAEDLHLMPDSPCIDAGTNSPSGGLPPTDKDGNIRFLDGNDDGIVRADIGVYEFDRTELSAAAVSPSGFIFTAREKSIVPEGQTLYIRNWGIHPLDWQVNHNISWLRTETETVSIQPGGTETVRLYVDHTDMDPGRHTDTVEIMDNSGLEVLRRLEITLIVTTNLHVPTDFPTIQEAIDAAIDGDDVVLTSGTYAGAGNKGLDFRGKEIVLTAEDGPLLTAIDCEGVGGGIALYRHQGSGTVIDGLTIKNCNNTAIAVGPSASPTINHCIFDNNRGGGAVTITGPKTQVLNSEFINNQRSQGGAIYISADMTTINSNLFKGNQADYGGAISIFFPAGEESSVSINKNIFTGNTAVIYGGALNLDIRSGLASITASGFYGNSAQYAGAVKIYGNGQFSVTNSVFSNNSATLNGGALQIDYFSTVHPEVSLAHITFFGNTATNNGDDISASVTQTVGSFDIKNSILWSDQPESGYNPIESTGTGGTFTVTVAHSDIKGGIDPDPNHNINRDPLFIDPDGPDDDLGTEDDDFRLDPFSPVIDRGIKIPWLFSDLRGSVRPIDILNMPRDESGVPTAQYSSFDMGAYEYSGDYGGLAGDLTSKAFKGVKTGGALVVTNFEYKMQWEDKNPFPFDTRIKDPGEYEVNILLVGDNGIRIVLGTYIVKISQHGYEIPFTFGAEHIGTWRLRVELVTDPNQYAESDIIDIEYKEATRYALGQRIIPPVAADPAVKPDIVEAGSAFWSVQTNRLYAVSPITTVITWYSDQQKTIPYPTVAYITYPNKGPDFPNDPDTLFHVSDSMPVDLLPQGTRFDLTEIKWSDGDPTLTGNLLQASKEGWSVILFRDEQDPDPKTKEKFDVIRTFVWNHSDDPRDDLDSPFPFPTEETYDIGKALSVVGHGDEFCGSGYVFFENSYYDGAGENSAYERATRIGPIYPVNEDLTGLIDKTAVPLADPLDDLLVVWYKLSSNSGVCWPSKPVRYDPQWPANAQKMVIASGLGSGPLDPVNYGLLEDMVIYNQPDRNLPGYNPLEEHAGFFTAPGSQYQGVFALRDDLNTYYNGLEWVGPMRADMKTTSSKPYVLLKYRSPDDGEWLYEVYEVVAQSGRYMLSAGAVDPDDGSDRRYYLNASGALVEKTGVLPTKSYYIDADGLLVNPGDDVKTCYNFGAGIVEVTCLPASGVNIHSISAIGDLQVAAGPFSIDKQGVIVENDTYYRFHYDTTAGQEINPVYPISELTFGPCVESYTSTPGSVLEDKDDKLFAKYGGLNGELTEDVVVKNFYRLQPGFFYDLDNNGVDDKALGTCIALLEGNTSDTPIDMNYAVSWPDPVPTLHVGETLVEAKTQTGETVGLPEIGGQCEVEILFDENGTGSSAKLIDPLTEYGVGYVLPTKNPETDLPGLKPVKNLSTGRWVFTALPYHLQTRLTYDEVAVDVNTGESGMLKLKGIYSSGVGEPMLLLNFLSDRELGMVTTLSGDTTFNTILTSLNSLAAFTSGYTKLKDAELKALTAGDAQGTGYVTVAFNNNVDCPAPTVLNVINVGCETYTGDLKVIESPNPFEEKVTLRHNGDFGGNADAKKFEWVYMNADNPGIPGSPVNDVRWQPYFNVDPSATPVDTTLIPDHNFYPGAVDTVIQGSGLQLLPDKWFAARYYNEGPICNGPSQWTEPQLYEGWIKRVMKKINLFDQKVKDFHASDVNTLASVISLAGTSLEGEIALSDDPEYLQNLGIIEVYETLLKRGKSLAGDAGSQQALNTALLFAANRLADLGMLLGNEAFGDAADPTIGFSTTDGQYGTEAPSIFSFQNQVESLLDEELALLRGRDNTGVQPFYNRLVWNFTLGDGEVAYKENYNITDQNSDGEVNELDAMIQYPQGHGDAWGYYLSAIKYYYELLIDVDGDIGFTWIPQSEAILVAGVPVQVDYRDERKFAAAAAARAKTGAEIVNLTYRKNYVEDPEGQWQGYKDNSDPDRAWGVDGWSRRAGQGALFDWIVGNAILPPEDTLHEGIAKVDRTTVVELREVSSQFAALQAQVDRADVGLNPLGVAKNAVPFDIDPIAISNGETHFEQIYDRAAQSMNNAISVFNHANQSTMLLRRQQDTLEDFSRNIENSEADFNNRLIELFGYPYQDDCGPGKTYPTDYCQDGPDLYHYMYVDPSELMGVETPKAHDWVQPMRDISVDAAGALIETIKEVTFHVDTDSRYGLIKPSQWQSRRKSPGEIQLSRSDLLQLRGRFEKALIEYDNLVFHIERQAELIRRHYGLNANEIYILYRDKNRQLNLNSKIKNARDRQTNYRTIGNTALFVGNAIAEGFPKVTGFIAGLANGVIVDALSVARSAAKNIGAITNQTMNILADLAALTELDHQQAKEMVSAQTNIQLTALRGGFAVQQELLQLQNLINTEATLSLEIYNLAESMQQASGRYRASLSRGDRLLSDRLRFRTQTAAQIQNYRYKDMTFRIFRNDAIQKYRAQFDMAAMYVYLAAKAYDYETSLLDSSSMAGQAFLTDIVRQRTIGMIEGGIPLTGTGLADPMRRMWQNFQVLKPQLGFNNPQQETNRFSLRRELFRVLQDQGSNDTWRQVLEEHRVADLWDIPEFRRYSRPFAAEGIPQPGIVIPFTTTVTAGLNFFGWPLGGMDSYYSSTNFATKVRSSGVWFSNYNSIGLAQTPRVYLIPVGEDVLRTPSYYTKDIRTWQVVDQKLPVPFPIVATEMENNPGWIPTVDTIYDEMFQIRRHSDFRAYHDSGFINQSEMQYDTRLVGRSVWNSKWLLIIPGQNLLYNPDDGLDTFIYGPEVIGGLPGERTGHGISDIKLFFETYSYSGN